MEGFPFPGDTAMAGKSFRDLIVWQKAMDLVEAVYVATAEFPSEELYGLVSQLRRASVSVPSNIAEGQGRRTNGEFAQFLHHAIGSLNEVETQVELSMRLRFMTRETGSALLPRIAEVGRLARGLVNSLET
jgi:four helix bundle protein